MRGTASTLRSSLMLTLFAAAEALQPIALRRSAPTVRPRVTSLRAQQGPLEDGFKGLMPLAENAEGDVEPEVVARIQQDVREIMAREGRAGVELEDLLNPSKVVNLERERIFKEAELATCTDAEIREELEERLAKIEKDLFREKRTVFQGWLKGLFIGQSLTSVVLSGVAVFDAFPGKTIDISLRALGFWSYWLFIIPSLRARRPRGWEKRALDIAFLGSPIITIGLPFVTKDPPTIWFANLALLVGAYGFCYLSGDPGPEEEPSGGFSGALKALDFGSGRERGMRSYQREAFEEQQQKKAAGVDATSDAEAEATTAASRD